MKRISDLILSIAVCMVACVALASCAGNGERRATLVESGNGYRVYAIEGVDELIASAVDVYVTVGKPTGEVRLEGDDGLLNDIVVDYDGGMLALNDRDNMAEKSGKQRVRAYLTVDSVDEVYATMATVRFDKPVDAEVYETNGKVLMGV